MKYHVFIKRQIVFLFRQMPKLKIAILGPECCGKSTLASDLAAMFHVQYVKEFAVEFLKDSGQRYTANDVIEIAAKQDEHIRKFAENEDKLLIADTEALVNKIWFEDKFKSNSPEIDKLWENQGFDIYLLCYPDIEWEYAEFRENPDDRLLLFEKYESYLLASFRKYFVVKGSRTERLQFCLDIIRPMILI